LEAAAPMPPQWAQAALPVRLMLDEVERVVAVYRDGPTAHRRNYAIVLLLARLGLRAGEVIALRLEDIDWFESRVLIRPGKTHQERCLPLAHDVGSALAAYLQHARPSSESRQVFLHDRAPYSPLTTTANVRWIVVQALQHAGVAKRPRIGSHLFRHTAASQMLNQGASFKDVADVLGHHCLQTTSIYAKLELDALAEVALPWLGGEQ
jgi:integrase